MTTEEKIKETITQAIEDSCERRTWRGDPLETAIKSIYSIFTSEIREEKIKMLEGMKYEGFMCETTATDGVDKGVCWQRKEQNREIDLKIKELREEGKEKGKV